jgi:predicted dehydrogenase
MAERSEGLSRRAFLRSTAAGAAAAGLSAFTVPATGRVLGASERIAVGVIGTGGRGTHLVNTVNKLKADGKGVEVSAVCDIYLKRLESARQLAGLAKEAAHTDYPAIVKDKGIDAVVVATPDHWHAKMTLDALKAGKDVYCEKPMTYTIEEAKEVAETVRVEDRVLQVGGNSNSEDRWAKANELIRKGVIGKVVLTTAHHSRNNREGQWNYAIDADANPAKNLNWREFLGPAPFRSWDPDRFFRWRKYWDYSGGIATDLFYHQLGHLMVALGPEFPKRVTANGGIYVWHDREVPDTFTMTIDYPSNHTILMMATMANQVGINEAIRGHEGTISFEDPGFKVRFEEVITGPKDEITHQNKRGGGAYEHMENFFECMRTREEPVFPAALGYKVMVAIGMGVLAYRRVRTLLWDARKQRVVG